MAFYVRDSGGTLRTFDQVFEQRIGGDPISSVGTPFNNSSGSDIINDYVPISEGSSLSYNTNYHADNNADLRNIFAAKGTVSRFSTIWADESPYINIGSCVADGTGSCSTTTRLEFRLESAGTASYRTTLASNFTPLFGTWYSGSGTGSDFEAKVSYQGGPLPAGVTSNMNNTWQTMNINRSISSEQTVLDDNVGGNTTQSITMTLHVRKIGNPSSEVSADFVFIHGTTAF